MICASLVNKQIHRQTDIQFVTGCTLNSLANWAKSVYKQGTNRIGLLKAKIKVHSNETHKQRKHTLTHNTTRKHKIYDDNDKLQKVTTTAIQYETTSSLGHVNHSLWNEWWPLLMSFKTVLNLYYRIINIYISKQNKMQQTIKLHFSRRQTTANAFCSCDLNFDLDLWPDGLDIRTWLEDSEDVSAYHKYTS